jgi:hypothetical protein
MRKNGAGRLCRATGLRKRIPAVRPRIYRYLQDKPGRMSAMKQAMRRIAALLLGLCCLAALGTAAADDAAADGAQEAVRYTFNCGIQDFDKRFAAIFDSLDETYAMGEEPNIEGAFEYHLPADVYAKVLIYEGNIEYVLLFLDMEHSGNQGFLWQYGAFMAAAVGDIPAGTWAVLLLEASNLKLEPQEPDLTAYAAGNLIMICQTDPIKNMLYVILEREEYEPQEPMDGSFQTGLAR